MNTIAIANITPILVKITQKEALNDAEKALFEQFIAVVRAIYGKSKGPYSASTPDVYILRDGESVARRCIGAAPIQKDRERRRLYKEFVAAIFAVDRQFARFNPFGKFGARIFGK